MVTRDDVAKHAGVSVAVVSYVVNNKPVVKEATRMKVLAAMDELGYLPNQAARSLKTKKSYQLVVLVNHIGNPFENGILLNLGNSALKAGYSLFFHSFESVHEDQLKSLYMGRVDGILLIGQSLSSVTIGHFINMDIPMLSITKPFRGHPDVPYIDIHWVDGLRSIIRHLKELGHTRIGFLSNQRHEHYHLVRYDAFLQAMQQENLAFTKEMLLESYGNLESAEEDMLRYIEHHPKMPFTAIVCADDLMAAGVLSACRRKDISIPGQLAVAGTENILMSSHTAPTITTLDYPRPQAAKLAIQMMLQQLDGKRVSSHLFENTELMVRASTTVK